MTFREGFDVDEDLASKHDFLNKRKTKLQLNKISTVILQIMQYSF